MAFIWDLRIRVRAQSSLAVRQPPWESRPQTRASLKGKSAASRWLSITQLSRSQASRSSSLSMGSAS